MKLLVLGGSGIIGNAFIKTHNDDFEITTTYNKNPIDLLNTNTFQCSLPTDFKKLEEFLLSEKPEVVINSIGFSNVDFCEENKKESFSLHVDITKKICDITSKINSRLIFLSSDYVFDGKKGNYSEENTPNPINYYGFTKFEAEKIILKYPLNTVLRTSVIYDWDKRVRFFNYVIEKLKKNEQIVATDDIFNSVTLVDSLIQSIFKIITLKKNGLFHIVDSTCASRFDFAQVIAKIFNLNGNLVKKTSIKETNFVAKRPQNVCLDNSKARKSLGVNFYNLEEGMEIVLKKYTKITKNQE